MADFDILFEGDRVSPKKAILKYAQEIVDCQHRGASLKEIFGVIEKAESPCDMTFRGFYNALKAARKRKELPKPSVRKSGHLIPSSAYDESGNASKTPEILPSDREKRLQGVQHPQEAKKSHEGHSKGLSRYEDSAIQEEGFSMPEYVEDFERVRLD